VNIKKTLTGIVFLTLIASCNQNTENKTLDLKTKQDSTIIDNHLTNEIKYLHTQIKNPSLLYAQENNQLHQQIKELNKKKIEYEYFKRNFEETPSMFQIKYMQLLN